MSVQEAVDEAIEEDLLLQDALARGIVKPSAAAIWLKKNRQIEGDPETIATAVRRYEIGSTSESFEEAWEALDGAHPQQNEEVSVFVVMRDPEARTIADIVEAVDEEDHEALRILPSGENLTIIVPRNQRAAVKGVLDPDLHRSPIEDLAEFAVSPGAGTSPNADALAIIISGLTAQGIEVPYAFHSADQILLYVHPDDSGEAFKRLAHVIDRARVDRSR